MKKVTINVLASDFEGNKYFNVQTGIKGCILERALFRAGIVDGDTHHAEIFNVSDRSTAIGQADYKIQSMIYEGEPIEDFSFEIHV